MTKYFSTRGNSYEKLFEEILFEGISKEDGGLFIPHHIPKLNLEKIIQEELSFNQLAYNIFRLFISEQEIPNIDLEFIINNSFKNFREKNVVKLQKLFNNDKKNFYILELFHGPSYSFKDIALQVLSNMISYFLEKDKNIKNTFLLCATSGDTGSAAIHSIINQTDKLGCIVLFPNFGVSPIQKAQMTTVNKKNIINFEVNGSFDDCQKMVKQLLRLNNLDVNFISVNSINWTRILTQIVYYVWTFLQINKELNDKEKINFSVPTGNFGDILAGFYAYKMGLPINKLIIATNENDILYKFMKTGEYTPKKIISTFSPAMDISISSNFERLLWHIIYEYNDDKNLQKCCNELQSLMNDLNDNGTFKVNKNILNSINSLFCCEKVIDSEIILEIKDTFNNNNYIIDPHTAVGINAYKKILHTSQLKGCTVCLSTAHPSKFPNTINLSLNNNFQSELNYLLSLPQFFKYINNDYHEIMLNLVSN